MKLAVSDITTETSGTMKEMSFGIGNMGLVLDILRSKLYKNPILAICREICCNARDAHVEVGKKDLPIEVHFPNTFDMHFKVRDFGPGIAPDRMEDIFVNFGSSTKRNTNDQIGGFGIGAKTPLAYSDTFSICTNYEGTQRIYNAYIDETKVGKMALVSEKPTTEPNGTTIKIPVLSKNVREFIDCTLEATQYWPVKPILKGISPAPTYKKIEIIHAGDGWSMLRDDRYNYSNSYYSVADYSSSRSVAVIDGIGYPLDVNSLSKLSDLQRRFLDNKFLFYFKNGDLSLSASRDSIHYDDNTQKFIVGRINVAIKEVIERINKEIESCNTYIEACDLYAKTIKSFNLSDKLKECTWRGHKVIVDIAAKHIGEWAKISVYYKHNKKVIHSHTRNDEQLRGDDPISAKLYHLDKIDKIDRAVVNYIFEQNPTLSRLRILCTPEVPSAAEYQNLITKGKTVNVKYDYGLLDLFSLPKLTDVKVPKKQPKSRIKGKADYTTILAYELSELQNGHMGVNVKEIDNQGGVYIEYDYEKRVFESEGQSIPTNMKLNIVEGLLGQKVWAFTKARVSKLHPEWKPLFQAIQAKLTELKLDENKIMEDSANSHDLFEHVYHYTVLSKFNDVTIKLLPDNCPIKEMFLESKRVEKSIVENKKFLYVLKELKKMTFEGPFYDSWSRRRTRGTGTLAQLANKIDSKYPLLSYINGHGGDTKRDIVLDMAIDYIKLVDESQAKAGI